MPPRPRGRGRVLPVLAVAVVAAAVGAGAAIGLQGHSGSPVAGSGRSNAASPGGAGSPNPATSTPAGIAVAGANQIPVPPSGAPAAASRSLNTQAVANDVEPSVVDVNAPQFGQQSLSEGTGIVLTSNGLVMTNNHVIEGSTAPTVTLVSTGKTYKATIVGYDASHDVALLQLTGASGLTPVTVGDSGAVKTGMRVLGIGNAQGQGGTPTVAPGSVTALNQTIKPTDSATGLSETLTGTIQTSSQIQPGDSGGPLANAAGQVIGMDVAAAQMQTFNGSSSTAGFAIPINQALQIARQIADRQASTDVQVGLPSFMGVSVADASKGCPSSGLGGSGGSGSGSGGLGGSGSGGFGGGGSGGSGGLGGSGAGSGSGSAASSGALVCGVFSGTPAQSAGLSEGDVITKADGQSVSSAQSLVTITSKFRPGQTLTVGYIDGSGASHSLTLTLINGPAK
ncbi:MAG TPA: trypsin-like peptidase domain-containing protein [Trebonia sp.]|nr:trypsin-like peptidase domain-containing protein [Trebonia sp.]